jgi:hypothetical protein
MTQQFRAKPRLGDALEKKKKGQNIKKKEQAIEQAKEVVKSTPGSSIPSFTSKMSADALKKHIKTVVAGGSPRSSKTGPAQPSAKPNTTKRQQLAVKTAQALTDRWYTLEQCDALWKENFAAEKKSSKPFYRCSNRGNVGGKCARSKDTHVWREIIDRESESRPLFDRIGLCPKGRRRYGKHQAGKPKERTDKQGKRDVVSCVGTPHESSGCVTKSYDENSKKVITDCPVAEPMNGADKRIYIRKGIIPVLTIPYVNFICAVWIAMCDHGKSCSTAKVVRGVANKDTNFKFSTNQTLIAQFRDFA